MANKYLRMSGKTKITSSLYHNTEEAERKKSYYTRYIIYVVILLVIIGTLSFALYSNVFTGKNDVIIDTNDLKFNYNETTNSITIENAASMTDEEGIANGGTFTFDVSATSLQAQTVDYAIYLTEESGNTLDSASLRMALLDSQNTTLVNPISYESLKNFAAKTNSKLLYGKSLNLPTDNNEKDMYVLKYWLANSQDEITTTTLDKKQTSSLLGGTFKFKVNVMVNPPSGAELLIKKVGTGGLVADKHPETLQLQATTDYRYTGANPDNYIKFNDEIWRIIGVFDVDDGSAGTENQGKLEKRIKIIGDSLGIMAWDDNRVNDWSKATGMSLLNSGNYYNRVGKYSSRGLTEEAKNLIADAKWYLGGSSLKDLANIFYTYERGKTVYTNRPINWIGKVGLMYLSDYGYATSGGSSTDRIACLEQKLLNWGDSAYIDCKNNDWLYVSSNAQWMLSPRSGVSHMAFFVSSAGAVDDYGYTYYSKAIRPSVYLKDDVVLSGEGTSDSPYEID